MKKEIQKNPDTIDLENKSIENLIDKTFQELFIKLIESIATK